ncbi:hypothetical protein Tco_0500570 [Tanacetum coccineum]
MGQLHIDSSIWFRWFFRYTVMLEERFGCVLSTWEGDAYASRQLKPYEVNYPPKILSSCVFCMEDLETLSGMVQLVIYLQINKSRKSKKLKGTSVSWAIVQMLKTVKLTASSVFEDERFATTQQRHDAIWLALFARTNQVWTYEITNEQEAVAKEKLKEANRRQRVMLISIE